MSNRTFRRIRSSLRVEVATRYGYQERPAERILEQLVLARLRGDWECVSRLAGNLKGWRRRRARCCFHIEAGPLRREAISFLTRLSRFL
jgi:hypothetical protein